MKCCICGTVKNCEKYLNKVLKNMEIIGSLFEDYDIILYYDKSYDNTLNILIEYQQNHKNFFLYVNKHEISNYRTIRLAHARNTCTNFVFLSNKNYDFFIMMDCDDVCSTKINIDILHKYLKRDDWDALSFNKEEYYDIWALSKYPYLVSFFHRKKNLHDEIKNNIKNLLKNLKENELLQCWSAFNGFCIYRKDKFKNCSYNGIFNVYLFPKHLMEKEINNIKPIIHEKDIEDCEHRSFHVEAIIKNNAKIFISPDILFI